MIDYINKRLNDWARWRVSDRALLRHMLGVNSCWPQMLKDDDPDQKYEKHGTLVPLNDLECCDTDKAVCALPPELSDAVIEYYTRIGTAETTAKRLGIAVRTLFDRIGRAHWHIIGTLNDLSAGIQSAPGPTLSRKTVDIGPH
jgi:DNA-directed RNA polymerase specialized sigma24 family protein